MNLYQRCHPTPVMGEYPLLPLLQKLAGEPAPENLRLWVDERGELGAYAVVHMPWRNLLFDAAPEARGQVEAQIIRWGAEYSLANPGEDGAALDTACPAEDTARHELLLAGGFVLQEGQTLHLLRSLSEPIQAPVFPEGFTVRGAPAQGWEAEAPLYAELHRDAFGTQYMTTEERLEIMREPGYRPELDLVAVAPDGTWAAFVVGNFDLENPAPDGGLLGCTDPIGTRPAYRRMGLARGLILYGMERLKAQGASYAAVSTLSTNLAMLRVLESAGYQVVSRMNWYSLDADKARQAWSKE